jgi:hypothetical protein
MAIQVDGQCWLTPPLGRFGKHDAMLVEPVKVGGVGQIGTRQVRTEPRGAPGSMVQKPPSSSARARMLARPLPPVGDGPPLG